MACDLCGKEGQMYKAEIERTVMTVCESCAKYGKVIGKVTKKIIIDKPVIRQPRVTDEPIETIVSGYGDIIRKARQSSGMKQEELAKKINEKESNIHAIESGHREPRIELARKLEKFLGITLIEKYAEEDLKMKTFSKDTKNIPASEMITIRQRKRIK